MKTLLVLLLLSGVAFALTQDGTLDNCVTAGTPCAGTNVASLDRKYVHVDITSGTFTYTVECQLRESDTWAPVAAAASVDALVAIPDPCSAIRMSLSAASSPVYTATYRGFPAAK
jgi:hypothetical protein